MKIIANKARCKLCGDVLVSSHEGYEYCSCKALAVAGGTEAILRLGHHNQFTEMSEKDYSK